MTLRLWSWTLLAAAFALGWTAFPEGTYGIYPRGDGSFAAWTWEALFAWSWPGDLSPFNPFAGAGSLLLPTLPWLSPGAWALLLPVPEPWRGALSYAGHVLPLTLALIWALRGFGLARAVAALGAALYLLLILPPFARLFVPLNWAAILPVELVIGLWALLALGIFARLDRPGGWRRLPLFWLCVLAAVASQPMTIVTWLPVLGIAGLALLIGGGRAALPVRLTALAGTVAGLWGLGWRDYLDSTASLSARAVLHPPPAAPAGAALDPQTWIDLARTVDLCHLPHAEQVLICPALIPNAPIGAVHGLALLAGLWLGWRRRGAIRGLGLGMAGLIIGLHAYHLAGAVSLFGRLHVLSTPFIAFPAYLFYGALLAAAGEPLWRRLPRWSAPSLAAGLLASVVVMALQPGLLRLIGVTPARIAHITPFTRPAPSAGPIITQLRAETAIHPGAPFRGWVAVLAGAPGGWIAPALGHLGSAGRVGDLEAGRELLFETFGNRFAEDDLWRFGIPTFDEYAQWVSRPIQAVTQALLMAPGDAVQISYLRALRHHPPALARLGIRFIVIDRALDDPGLRLITQEVGRHGHGLWLYEVTGWQGASVPDRLTSAPDAAGILATLRAAGPDLPRLAVLDTPPPPGGPVHDIAMTLIRDGLHLRARAMGAGTVLLPIQFSHCWQARGSGAAGVSLRRANLAQTLVHFAGEIDIDLTLEFGPLNMGCRLRDATDLDRLGVP